MSDQAASGQAAGNLHKQDSAGSSHETNLPPQGSLAELLSSGESIEVLECDKSGNVQQRWLHKADNQVELVLSPNSNNGLFFRYLRGWRKALYDSFLPVGFPHSVSDDYLAYQLCDSIQAFFSTITSLLANRALLEGLGVGDANSSATFAMLLTILTDAMSRIATILFANRFGLRIEPDAKRYRFLADLFNDTAFFLELYSPYLGAWGKITALSTGAALRALCGVAAGASKAALSVHFAKHDNLAELNAKEASQETAVGLVGLLVGTLVVKMVEDHRSVVYLMILLVFGHLWVNYVGVCSVYMTTLNRQRATILFSEYLRTGTVLSPKQVAKKENVLFFDTSIGNKHGHIVAKIDFAKSYQDAVNNHGGRDEISVLDGDRSTIVIASDKQSKLINFRILLWGASEPLCAAKAWFACMKIAWEVEKGRGFTKEVAAPVGYGIIEDNGTQKKGLVDHVAARLHAGFVPNQVWESLITQGWDLGTQSFETGAPVRLRFQVAHRKDE